MSEDCQAIMVQNLLGDIRPAEKDESFTTILDRPRLRIERIVSHGHSTPIDQPYQQTQDEWVMVVEGAARLWLEGAGEVELGRGDHLLIPAGLRHRVTWTAPGEATVWLAVHIDR